MPDTLLQQFDGDGDDVPLMMARNWAETTAQQLHRAKELRARFNTLDRAYERMDPAELTWEDVTKAFSAAWIAESMLIMSASQFEVWMSKLYLSRGRPEPERMPYLRELRNSVVHLDEAKIDDQWVATAGTRQGERYGIGALPSQQLEIWLSGSGDVLGVLSADNLERYIGDLLGELDRELDDYARDWFDFINSGR